MYLAAALTCVKKCRFQGNEFEVFEKLLNFEDQV
jgi:hypothetical protein